eukprot:g47964.t1
MCDMEKKLQVVASHVPTALVLLNGRSCDKVKALGQELENIGNFIKAITKYGVKLHDSFEANDLYEGCNLTQVQTTLMALASMAKTKGYHTRSDIGVRYAEKQQRAFDNETLKAGQNIIGLQ